MEAMHAELLTSSEVLRKGGKRDRVFDRNGWTFHTVKAPIQTTTETYALNRELQLFQTQKVPEATFVNNSVEIRHDASGVVLSFCALEGLRAWCSLGAEPLQVSAGTSAGWDWTFTTPYTGTLSVLPIGLAAPVKPDSSSIFPRSALNLACGKATLRNPLCNCRGVPRPVLIMPASCDNAKETHGRHTLQSPWLMPPSPPLAWERVDRCNLDWQELLCREPPLFVDQVDLFQDDMHDFGISHLFVRVYVATTFWMVTLRHYLRVEQKCAKVIESRFLCRFHAGACARVLRQCSWKEGDWASLIGGDKSFSIEHLNDSVASQRLPEKQPETWDQLLLPTVGATLPGNNKLQICWERLAHFRGAWCAGGDVVIAAEGDTFEVIDAVNGTTRWQSKVAGDADVLTLSLTRDAGKLAVGDDLGIARIWTVADGVLISKLDIASTGLVNTKRWIECISWSDDGCRLSLSAGCIVVTATMDGKVKHKHEEQTSVAAVTFLPNGCLAIAAYGGVRVLDAISDEMDEAQSAVGSLLLERSAASVQCVAVSPDGKHLAAGCLDKTMRVWELGGDAAAVDWVGFNGPIVCVAWSASGNMLAACAGNSVMVTRSIALRGESPTLCRGCGVPEPEGGLGSCPRLTALVWCPSPCREHVLLASSTSGCALLFDVSAADHSFPKRCSPLAEIRPPGAALGLQLDLVTFACGGSTIVVASDDKLASFAVDDCMFADRAAQSPLFALAPGCEVLVFGLTSRPELNNQKGTLGEFSLSKGRWQVKVAGSSILLKACNLKNV